MSLTSALSVTPGITAVIGSGGKTSMLSALARELSDTHTVILATSTHILPFPDLPLLTQADPKLLSAQVRERLKSERILSVGTALENGKLTAPALSFAGLAKLADYVIVEADGSRRLPVKAHAGHEPVIPDDTNNVICVLGASGFARPIREAVHRFEIYCALTGRDADDPVTPSDAVNAIRKEGFADRIFVNQADLADAAMLHEAAQAAGNLPLLAGTLRPGVTCFTP